MIGFRAAGLLTRMLLLAAALPAVAAAQVVRGQVVDGATRAPVIGAHVLLLDAAGQRQASVLTNTEGVFQLGARTAGRYSVRVEMIGHRTLEREDVDVLPGQTIDLRLELSIAPIALAALDVRSARRCEVRRDAGVLTQAVWEEARKALSIEAAVRAQGLYQFTIERFTRKLDRRGRQVLEEDVRTITGFAGEPFYSKPAAELIESGFFDSREDGNVLYGPNADVLLSDAFLDTHCFFLRRDEKRPDQIGLAFEPVRGRAIADIRGTLWLDERSATLKSMEFTYVNLPASLLPRGDRGGSAEFQRLPDGAFIIAEWAIHSPLGVNVLSRSRQGVWIHEDGGRVIRIEGVRGATVREALLRAITEQVMDRVSEARQEIWR